MERFLRCQRTLTRVRGVSAGARENARYSAPIRCPSCEPRVRTEPKPRPGSRREHMSIDYVVASVCPAIPREYLTDVEAWLLTRVFDIEQRGDHLAFRGSWSLNDIYEGMLSPDQALIGALASSRELCPGLCVAV